MPTLRDYEEAFIASAIAGLGDPKPKQMSMDLERPGQAILEEPIQSVKEVINRALEMLGGQLKARDWERVSNGDYRCENSLWWAYHRLRDKKLVRSVGRGWFQLTAAARTRTASVGTEPSPLVMVNSVNRESAALTREITGGVNGPDYNRVHLNRRVFEELLNNGNSGVAALAAFMKYPRENHALQHPGQVVSEIKGRLEMAGLRPGSWKRVSCTSPAAVREVCHIAAGTGLKCPAKDRLVHLEGAMAMLFNSLDGAALPSRTYLAAAMRLYWGTNRRHLSSERDRGRLQGVMTLLLADEGRGGKALTGNPDSIRQIRAYVLASPSRPESRTWAGLARAAARWWEERAHKQEREEFLREANQVGGCIHWNSLINRASIGPYTFQALTNEYDLLLEGQRQRHCVFQYVNDCVEHATRIFCRYPGSLGQRYP